MKPICLPLLLSLLLPACTNTGQAERMGLPAPAAQAVLKAFPDAVIVEPAQRRDAGRINLYDARFYSEGLVRTITVSGSGTVLSIAQPMTIGELPKGAADSIAKSAGVTKLEKQNVWARVRDGQIVSLGRQPVLYQAQITRETAVATIDVLSDGTILEGPRWQPVAAEARPQPAPAPQAPSNTPAPQVDPGVSLERLPGPVRATIRYHAAGNLVRRVEPVTVSGKIVCYEAQWQADGRDVQIHVAPNGAVVSKPVEDDRQYR